MPKTISLSLLCLFFLSSCHTAYQPRAVQYDDYRISQQGKDAGLAGLLKPYSDSVTKSMSDVIAIASMDLEKNQPEGTLGNLVADIMKALAEKYYSTHVDVAVMNSGGIRINTLPAGKITRGKIFELSPFDNVVVVMKLTGTQLQSFLDHTASRGGWPVSGITMQIKDKKAINIKINNVPLDTASQYTLATLDYVANGGDNSEMLRTIWKRNNGYLFRDGIIDYISDLHKMGINISSKLENRVSNVQ